METLTTREVVFMKTWSRGIATLTATAMLLLLSIAAAGALVLPGCGGSNGGGATETAASPSSGGTTTPTAEASEADVIAAYAAILPRLEESGVIDDLMALYADDACMEDRAYGASSVGKDQIRAYFTQYFTGGNLSDKIVSTYVGSGCAVVESLAYSPGVVALPAAEIIKLDGGLITTHYVYYYDGQIGREAEPLQTEAEPGDTEAESLRTARAYLSALRATDVEALARTYAADVVYRDTAHKRSFAGADAATEAHAAVFAMKGVKYEGDGVFAGPGWAAVLWRRTDREGRQIAYPDLPDDYLRLAKRPTVAGVSVLEIRAGKVVRETVYCDHLRTRL
jgi:ketosteroid isomerase-like protein